MALNPERGGMGWRQRASIGTQVALAGVLALAATILVTWLAERGPLRWRADLTASNQNTLDAQTARILGELPVEVRADVFFSAPEGPTYGVALEAQSRMLRLLRLCADQSGANFRLDVHDLSDRTRLAPATQTRRHELGLLAIEPGGLVAISAGGRRQILRLAGEIAELDPGNADPRQGPLLPARLVRFRGEEALLSAVLRVCEDRTPVAVFTRGHGETDLESPAESGAALLKKELESQGFRVTTWDGSRGASLPEDCDVLVAAGPAQRFTDGEFAEIARYVEGGGRLLAALVAKNVGEHGLEGLLARFGIRVRGRGIVCAPVPAVTGGMQTGIAECAFLTVGFDGMPAQNTITDPLRVAGRRVYLFAARALERGEPPPRGRVVDILRAPPEAWLEQPASPAEERYDFQPGEGAEYGRHSVAMQAAFPPLAGAAAPRQGAPSESREARVVALGSSDALANHLLPSNRDFLVNAFDWLVSREYRVRVETASAEARRLDLSTSAPIERVWLWTVLLLPGACLGLGLLTAWRRRRT